jgi:hypothetical protein
MRLEKLFEIEKLNYLIGNSTRDLPNCSIVPQPTAVTSALPPGENGICITYISLVLYITDFLDLLACKFSEVLNGVFKFDGFHTLEFDLSTENSVAFCWAVM